VPHLPETFAQEDLMACLDTTLLIDLTGRGGVKRQKAAEKKLLELVEQGAILAVPRQCFG